MCSLQPVALSLWFHGRYAHDEWLPSCCVETSVDVDLLRGCGDLWLTVQWLCTGSHLSTPGSHFYHHLRQGKPMYVALAQRRDVRKAQLEQQYTQRMPGVPGGGGRGGPGGPGMFPMGGPGMGGPWHVLPAAQRHGRSRRRPQLWRLRSPDGAAWHGRPRRVAAAVAVVPPDFGMMAPGGFPAGPGMMMGACCSMFAMLSPLQAVPAARDGRDRSCTASDKRTSISESCIQHRCNVSENWPLRRTDSEVVLCSCSFHMTSSAVRSGWFPRPWWPRRAAGAWAWVAVATLVPTASLGTSAQDAAAPAAATWALAGRGRGRMDMAARGPGGPGRGGPGASKQDCVCKAGFTRTGISH